MAGIEAPFTTYTLRWQEYQSDILPTQTMSRKTCDYELNIMRSSIVPGDEG